MEFNCWSIAPTLQFSGSIGCVHILSDHCQAVSPTANLKISDTTPAKQVAKRWSAALIEAGGFTPVSIFFLENYSSLPNPLTHAEAMFVIHLIRHKFDEKAPYPGFATVAKRMGVTPTAARGYARALEAKGYLRREERTARTSKFHLATLFAALEKLIPQPNDEVEPF